MHHYLLFDTLLLTFTSCRQIFAIIRNRQSVEPRYGDEVRTNSVIVIIVAGIAITVRIVAMKYVTGQVYGARKENV